MNPSLRHLRHFLVAAALALPHAGCLIVDSNSISVVYDVDPQEFAQDFGTQSGTVPDVPCASDATCTAVPAPSGAKVSCDTTAKKCVVRYDLRLVQSVDLSSEKRFPSTVANSSVINMVQVNAIHYWAATNTLTVASPPIDLYVGAQAVQTETDPGATQLGTIPSLDAKSRTSCKTGDPGTEMSDCDMTLTDAGKQALATLAKLYTNPFNVIVVAHLTVEAGQPIPGGSIDLFVQPEIAFVIPLSK